MTDMTLEDLAREVQHVRRLQDKYFRIRDRTHLAECKDAERRLDEKAKAILAPPPEPSLFEDQP